MQLVGWYKYSVCTVNIEGSPIHDGVTEDSKGSAIVGPPETHFIKFIFSHAAQGERWLWCCCWYGKNFKINEQSTKTRKLKYLMNLIVFLFNTVVPAYGLLNRILG